MLTRKKCPDCGGLMDRCSSGLYTCWACFDIDAFHAAMDNTTPLEQR